MSAELPKPGIYRGIPYDVYSAWPAVRSSDLKHFDRSAAHARHAMLNPTDTAAQILGNAMHVAILEPDRFAATYAIAPKLDRRTTAGKAQWAAFCADNAGRIVLEADEHALCSELSRAAMSHPTSSALLTAPGASEVSLVWIDPETKLACKARLDRLCSFAGVSTIADFKSAADASKRGFGQAAARLGYQVQAAWYLRGADALSPVPRDFVFVAVEKEPPYCVAHYRLDGAFLADGQERAQRALVALANARESGVWPGYSTSIQTLYAPGWLRTPEPEEDTAA